MSYISEAEWRLKVSKGQVPGHSVVDKFGKNETITTGTDPEDIWEGGGVYPYDAINTAPIVSLASNDSGDTEVISIQGLDIDGNFVEQEITLSGTTRVALTTPLWRVYRMINMGDTSLDGMVFCYTGTGAVPSVGDSEVRAIIDDGNNQTLMCLYTIPLGKVGFLYRGEIGIEDEGNAGALAEYARCQYKSRRVGKVFTVKKEATLMVSTGNYVDDRVFPDPIPALTDIKTECVEVSAAMGLWATFDILLVDEDQFSAEYLTAIGQPSVMP